LAARLRSLVSAVTLLGILLVSTSVADAALDYPKIVHDYMHEEVLDVVPALARVPTEQIDEALDQHAKMLADDELRAAAMLHTEVAFSVIDTKPSLSSFHIGSARRMLRLLSSRRTAAAYRAFTHDWHVLVAQVLIWRSQADAAEIHIRLGLDEFPRDPDLLTVRGTLTEMRAVSRLPDVRNGIDIGTRSGTRTAALLELAATDFRGALAFNRRHVLARLRLGWVHLLLRDNTAQADLRQALADATTDRERYLAHLFLGAVAERRDRLAEAQAEYEAAREVNPLFQTAHVALSRVLEAQGQIEASRAHALVAVTMPKQLNDPWWEFHLVPVDLDLYRALRAAARGQSGG
jgi:tetratricopeptide (TPR) repeat protein